MGTFGRRILDTIGRVVRCSADGRPRQKAGGVTIDWSTVTAVTDDTTLSDGTVVKAGDKYLRYGQVLGKITATGYFGPIATAAGGATAATDGRQTVDATVRGDAFILDETVLLSQSASDHPAVFDGGLVFKSRLLMGGNGQPTEAQVETMFPDVTFVTD